jgi:CMP-N,N'-diacetyllegionaminic acid synthase
MKNILAIIPARSGSKSIPNKNILDFAGLPLIAHSINQAKDSKYINRVIVSTDSKNYSEIAMQYGAEVPFLRPRTISQDESLDIDTFIHALEYLKYHENYVPDLVVHLRPTHPIRNVTDIDNMIEIISKNIDADSIRSVVKASETPYKMWFLHDENILKPIIEMGKELYNEPRQMLPVVYYQNANIDIIRTETILTKKSMTGDIILGYVMDKSYDIDYIEEYNKYQFIASLQKGLKKFVIDIDGIITILNPNLDYENSQPNLSNIAVINKLFDAGNNIVLFTARGYKSKIDWRETTENQLKRWGVKHHELIFGKPDADYYIDDKFIDIHLIEKIL